MTADRSQRDHGRTTDDGVAMLVVLVCMLLASMLSIGLLGMITSELVPTAHQRKSARTLAAAHAGIEAGLATIRAATSTTSGVGVGGDARRLPCYPSNRPLRGDAAEPDRTQPTASYTVQIRYYTVNPAGQTEAWRTANALACNPGRGVAPTPAYALLQSQGTATDTRLPGTWGDRATEAVYTLRRTDQAVLGGLVRTARRSTSVDLCWQAAAMPATTGTGIRLATCNGGDEAQLFAYRTDYSLVLAVTQSAMLGARDGLCLQQDAGRLTLQPCVTGSWRQQWSYGNNGQFMGVRSDRSALSDVCVSTGNTWAAGTTLFPATCAFPTDVWNPESPVGAGAAGPGTAQLVNYGEYGRCLDITFWDVTYPWLINYPCKQDPTSAVGWNQRWTWDGAGTRQIQSNTSSGLYCLTAPASGNLVRVQPCVAGQASQQWAMLGDTGVRSTSYTVVDSTGRCLGLVVPPTTDARLLQWSAISADRCDGTAKQKWNAPAMPAAGQVGAERETTGGS